MSTGSPSERAATTAPEASARKPASPSTESRSRRTGARRGDEGLVHISRESVHRVREEDRVEGVISAGRRIPRRRILHDSSEGLRPSVFDSESHCIGQVLFKRVRRHALQTIGVYSIHEFLKAEHGNAGAPPLHRLRGHLPCKHPPEVLN